MELLEVRALLSYAELFNPDWSMVLSSFGYSGWLFDQRPGLEYRDYLSGDWAGAVAYNLAESGPVGPTWLEPEFYEPDWQTNSDFSILTPITVNDEEYPTEAWSVITNGDLEIAQGFQMIDTVFGTPMGISPASASGEGAFVPSNRYVLRHSYEITNVSGEEMTDLQLFQFLHSLNAHTSLYDNHPYEGVLGVYQYDTTQFGTEIWESEPCYQGSTVAAQMFDPQGIPAGNPCVLASTGSDSVGWVGDTVALADGFAVFWYERTSQSGHDELSVTVQCFDGSGAPLGPPQLAAEWSGDPLVLSSAAVPLDGGFVALWQGSFEDRRVIVARRFDASGTPLGNLQILREAPDEWTVFYQLRAAPLADGFVITWSEQPPSSPVRILAQRYDSAASPVGETQVVVEEATGLSYRENLAVLPWGDGFLAVWNDTLPDGQNVMAQPFDAAGEPVGDPFPLLTTTTDLILQAFAVPLDDGLLLTWHELTADYRRLVLAQRFDASGLPLTDPPVVVLDAPGVARVHLGGPLGLDDGYVVTWLEEGAGGDRLMTQRFDLSDSPMNAPQVVAEDQDPDDSQFQTQWTWTPVAVDETSFALAYSCEGYRYSVLEDYVTFHSQVAPHAWDNGYYGIEGYDDHESGKPSVGVHLSIEDNALGNADWFDQGLWVSGAQRWDLGALAPGETVVFDVIVSILSGTQVTEDSPGGVANGGASEIGGLEFLFGTVLEPGTLFVSFAPVDVNSHEYQQRIDHGQFGHLSFGIPGSDLQLWDVWFSGEFEGSVELTVHYDDSLLPPGFDESLLGIYHWNGWEWEWLDGVVDPWNDTITFSISSLSPFALGTLSNHPPVLDPIGDQTVDEQTVLQFTVTASDPEDVPPNGLTLHAEGLPPGATFDPETGVFTWTPTEDQDGTYWVTFRVIDDGVPALGDQETILITVEEVNAPPVLDPIGDQSVDEGATLSFTATATDQDLPVQTLTFNLDPASVALGMQIDPRTGVFTWTPTETQQGRFRATITVTDDGANPPTLSHAETITITVGEVVDLAASMSGYSIELRRKGANLELAKRYFTQPFWSAPANTIYKLTIRALENKSDTLTVDYSKGMFQIPDGIVFDAKEGRSTDGLVLKGTSGNDTIEIDADRVVVNGTPYPIAGIERVTLDGGRGNDTYRVAGLGVRTNLIDGWGTDRLDFSHAAVPVSVDLSLAFGQPQRPLQGTDHILALSGVIEHLVGSPFSDILKGNSVANRIWGGAGNDTLYGSSGDDWLYGELGNDVLFGDSGNDLLLGAEGNDQLYAGLGRNILIGGPDADTLRGSYGEEILIGGTTSYDANDAALAALLAEWKSARSFSQRCNNLDAGITHPTLGTIRLKRRDAANPTGTVLDDAARDVLFGGSASDWFLGFATDELRDRGPGDR